VKKVRLGIVGLGRLGMRHAETARYCVRGAELVAACSLNPAELAGVKEQLGVEHCYSDFGQMIAGAGIDAVLVVSSSSEHVSHITQALDAGLHVFSEKPLGTTIEECRTAEKSVETHRNLVFMLGFMRRFDPSYAYAKRQIAAGAVGQPFMVRAYGLDPDALIDGALRFAATSGGIFLDMMIHDIDLARWFLGAEATMVHAIGGTFKYPDFALHGDVDNATALMQFEGGGMALFFTGRTAAHGYHIETEIVGTEGQIRIDGVPRKNRVTLYSERGTSEACVEAFPERFGEAFTLEIQEFVDCIREGRRPEVSVHDGTRATAVAYAATESLRSGKPVYLSPR